ncbi:chitinase 1-like [Punica granatum]|uniref:Chitinase 1-like n=1 Tax=Punica granatum TaxID=22663 RepID=A0A6P8E3T0_PUNGR|nr:chitinase 1-like [Punica granatum]
MSLAPVCSISTYYEDEPNQSFNFDSLVIKPFLHNKHTYLQHNLQPLSDNHIEKYEARTSIIQHYNLDGIDIDYEHFKADPETFAECIGQLISTLKNNGVIQFASIAPFADDDVQSHYLALWRKYGHIIDYVNFQFYAYDQGTTVSQFLNYFDKQASNYDSGKVLVSFISDGSGGLSPENGFFTACSKLKSEGKLNGIFIWSADDSKANGFQYEKQSQAMLSIAH